MSDFTSCPSCRLPLVVPNPAKCSCGLELGAGSRERTTPADPRVLEAEKPLMTVAMQSEAQVALIEELLGTAASSLFDVTHDGRPLKDADLELPPGTLGRDLALALGKPPEIFAEVAHLVTLLTFNEKVEAATCAERIEQFVQLTALGRHAASSPAARALVLYTSDRVIQPEEFLRLTSPRADGPLAPLLVWLDLLGDNGEIRTRGMETFALPEVVLSPGPSATDTETQEAVDAVFTVAHQMLQRRAQLADGTMIGNPGSTTFEVHSDVDIVRLTSLP